MIREPSGTEVDAKIETTPLVESARLSKGERMRKQRRNHSAVSKAEVVLGQAIGTAVHHGVEAVAVNPFARATDTPMRLGVDVATSRWFSCFHPLDVLDTSISVHQRGIYTYGAGALYP